MAEPQGRSDLIEINGDQGSVAKAVPTISVCTACAIILDEGETSCPGLLLLIKATAPRKWFLGGSWRSFLEAKS